ncbi:MAG: sigma-70 family RNA polymerase sigma factor [Planctomycetota bacterium]|nr:sigma-70 family RNA polymerase sigma factor [Planctomycetota bacterium]
MSSDEDMVARAAAGDLVARDALFAAHQDALRAYVRLRLGRHLRSREESLDLAQSVVREALEDLPRFEFRGEGGFRRWLLMRAENKIKDRGRFWNRARRDPRLEVALSGSATDDAEDRAVAAALQNLATPSREAAGREELARLERAFAELSEEQRRVILLSRVAGMPHEDVARAMGRTVLATRSLLSRAVARLALLMEE